MRLKRLISAFIACAMLVTFMPMQAFAAPKDLNDTEFHINGISQMKELVSDKTGISIDQITIHGVEVNGTRQGETATATGGVVDHGYLNAGDVGTLGNSALAGYPNYWNVLNTFDIIDAETVSSITVYARKDYKNLFNKGGRLDGVTVYLNPEDVHIIVNELEHKLITEIGLAQATLKPQYTLTYDVNGGTGEIASQTYSEDTRVSVISVEEAKKAITRDEAALLGFSETQKDPITQKADCPELLVGVTMAKDTTLYAVWAEDKNKNGTPDYDETKYTVTYKDGVEQAAFKNQVYSNLLEGIDTPDFDGTPSLEGFEFAGWEPKVAKTVTEKATYTAQWVEDEEPVKSTNGYFYVLKPGSQGDLTTTDPQHFYYVGQGNIQEVPEEEITFEDDGVEDQIVKVPSIWPEGADKIKSAVGTNFENVFWYRVSQASGANGNPGYENPVSANTLAWHVDGILKPKSPNYQVRFILKQGETETVLNVYDIPFGTSISNQNIQSAANKALQIGNPGAGHVVRWTNANGQVVTDGQIIAATKQAPSEAVLVFYAEFVQPAMPTVQEALADYKKTVTAPESVETFRPTVFKFKLEKQNGTEWEAVEKATYQVGGVTYSKLCTVPVSQPVKNLTIAGTNDDLQPGTYRLTEVQTEEEREHWAKNNQQFTFTVTNDGKIVRADEETVFKNTYLVPKLSVTKQLSKVNDQPYTQDAMVSVGDTLTYTITVENTGNVDLNNVTVTDIFTGSDSPTTSTEGVTWEQEPDGSSYKATWRIGALNQGNNKATMTYTYTVTDADKGKTIANTAVAGSDEITENKPQDMISVNVATDKQITVNYYSNNTDYGTVSVPQQVFTEGDWTMIAGDSEHVKINLTATAKDNGGRTYFNEWQGSLVDNLGRNITENKELNVEVTAKIGQTYTIIADFGRNSGGGAHHPDARDDDDDDNDRDDEDDTEESIDEEVPLAETPWLNTEDHYAYIIGYSEDGTVRPNANISRAEVATIFFRLLTDEARDQFWMTTNNFSDVLPNDWYNNAVSTMVNMGIIQGYEDGTFRPNANITRAEFAAIAARFMSSGYDVEEDLFTDIANHWARESINDAAMAGWINGYEDGAFRPDAAITRAEAVTLVNNVLQRKPDADHMFDSMIKWPDNPESAWYYEAIQEATNSHDYDLFENAEYETWTALRENRNWAALEKDWVNTHRAGGEVA